MSDVIGNYAAEGVLERILEALSGAGVDVDRLDPETLAGVDQFHLLGAGATRELGQRIGAHPGMQVVDLGSGLGGPARLLAQEFGATLRGVDLSLGFVDAAEELTRRCGLADRVTFQVGDITDLPWPDASADAAVMLHVNMNVGDKAAIFGESARVLRPGGRFALWEICRGEEGSLSYPVPWAADPSTSFLATPEELQAAASNAGFTVLRWDDLTDSARAFFERLVAEGPPPGPGLGDILPDFAERLANVAAGVAGGSVRTIQGLLER